MGATFSCPFASLDDLDSQFESYLVRSISFGGSDDPVEPSTFNSLSSRKMILEGSLSFKGREFEAKISVQGPTDENVSDQLAAADNGCERNVENLFPESGNQRHEAALKLQKTYKSFRTRRQLADCAVLVEQRWWKLLDFAELKHSSISFFDVERPETALSRWSRARTKAAKVGKGLSKDEKARKLALQHWLEAIDPRHRYGHNLQFYYVSWLHCDSKQPFFYWLDIGEGKEVNLERCPRSKLQQQCIKYLGPTERKAYEVVLKDGKFIYEQSGHLLDTNGGPKDVKWIFVLSVSKILYVGQKIKGTFQHSSFLAGGATLSAGRLEVEQGTLKAVWPHSGHYLPTEENFEEFMSFLKQHSVDLSVVQRAPNSDDEVSFGPCKSLSAPDISEANSFKAAPPQQTDSSKQETTDAEITNPSLQMWSRKLSSIQIPKRKDIDELFKNSIESPDGYETAVEYLSDSEFSVSKDNLFDEDREEPIPEEKIIKRINSHKGLKSYQLAKQLSCKWTTGAGPRIGCVRDYPWELQVRALEEVHLSPRSTTSSPPEGIASPLCRGRSLFASESPKLTLMATDNKNQMQSS